MGKKNMIGSVPYTDDKVFGMLSDLMSKLKSHAKDGGGISPRELDLFLKRKNPFVTPQDVLEVWQKVYWDVFQIEPDFSSMNIPIPSNIDGKIHEGIFEKKPKIEKIDWISHFKKRKKLVKSELTRIRELKKELHFNKESYNKKK